MDLMMHESEAKALVKGAFRKAEQRWDELIRKPALKKHNSRKKGFSSLREAETHIYNDINYYYDFLLKTNKFIGRSSKHALHEVLAIEAELISIKNIGSVSRFVCNVFDTRKMLKGHINAMNSFQSNFYFEEHFIIRAIQRLNLDKIGEIGIKIFPVIISLAKNNISLKGLTDDIYIVFNNYVIVVNYIREPLALVFKTILLKEFFTEKDKYFYKLAYEKIANNSFVIMNKKREIHDIYPNKNESVSIIENIYKNSDWFPHIIDHTHLNGENILKKLKKN